MSSKGIGKYRTYTNPTIGSIPQVQALKADARMALLAVAKVLPFKTNQYILDELIDWMSVPHDPIFTQNFPVPDMLLPEEVDPIVSLLNNDPTSVMKEVLAQRARIRLMQAKCPLDPTSIPNIDGQVVPGLWRTFRETVLVYPMHAQGCFAFCTHCFRWMRHFGIGNDFCTEPNDAVAKYLERNPEISDVVLSGGDPMVMSTEMLNRYIDPLFQVESLRNIRISTRSISWWPYRFTNEADSDDLLRLFETIVERGKSLSIQAQVCHVRELSTPVVENAIRRIRSSGAIIRCQFPMLNHVNADVRALVDLWSREVSLGLIPYYLFVEDGAGPADYFKLPVVEVLRVYKQAQSQISGLARTVRGPVFNYQNNKVMLDDIVEFRGEKFFVLKYIQAHRPEDTGRVVFAKFDKEVYRSEQLQFGVGEPSLSSLES